MSEQLPAHQQRVLDEEREVEIRRSKLADFIKSNPAFSSVDPAEQDRLRKQLIIMQWYVEILRERIGNFS